MLILYGYGIRVSVSAGHLLLHDGIADERRTIRLARVNHGLRRHPIHSDRNAVNERERLRVFGKYWSKRAMDSVANLDRWSGLLNVHRTAKLHVVGSGAPVMPSRSDRRSIDLGRAIETASG